MKSGYGGTQLRNAPEMPRDDYERYYQKWRRDFDNKS